MKIVVAPAATRDLQETYDFILRDSVQAADQFLIRMSQSFGLLASSTAIGREVTLKDGSIVRS